MAQMNTEAFTFAEFDQLDSPVFANTLAERLKDAVLLEISSIAEEAFRKIVLELNAVGHNLVPYQEQSAGAFHVRSATGKTQSSLLLACDIVITTAFRTGPSPYGANNPDA